MTTAASDTAATSMPSAKPRRFPTSGPSSNSTPGLAFKSYTTSARLLWYLALYLLARWYASLKEQPQAKGFALLAHLVAKLRGPELVRHLPEERVDVESCFPLPCLSETCSSMQKTWCARC